MASELDWARNSIKYLLGPSRLLATDPYKHNYFILINIYIYLGGNVVILKRIVEGSNWFCL